MNLCLFDLDHTLLPLDSDHEWGQFMVRIGWADAGEFKRRNDEFYRHYQEGVLDPHAYIEFATGVWRSRPPEEQEKARQRFMREVIEPALQPQARSLVEQHRERGDLIALVTATNDFITSPIAEAFGIEHLLAVQLERDLHGRVTGHIRGTPSFREGKVTRVDEWLADLGHRWSDFPGVSFYSDSMNDLPLLERASDPVATNPSLPLEALARARGWRILNLFA
ncbi:MAG: HAD family hydrolase [Aquabacterium sp.]|nr:MAG: HAD family hydrolase [Aquabacterium sp.]